MQEKRGAGGRGQESKVQKSLESASQKSTVDSRESRSPKPEGELCNPQSVVPDPRPPTPDPQTSGNAEAWLAGDPNTIAVSQGENRPAVARVRVTYSKLAEARFLGAKEVATLFARASRRARLPVAYSQGFHPLPRLSFGSALPLGIESEEEFLDIELSEPLAAAEVGHRLGAELPRGFVVHWAEAIELRAPSIEASIRAFRYLAA